MTILEAGLRGGAIALLLLLAIIGGRDARHSATTRYSMLFELCVIAYLIESAPPLSAVCPPWLVPIRILSNATAAVFQLWAKANFDDGFVPRWWRWLPFVGLVALASVAMATDQALAWHATQLAALLLVIAGIWQTLAGRAVDLIEQRRRFRLVLAIGAGAFIAWLTLLGAAESEGIRAVDSAVRAGGVLAITLASALLRLRLESPPGFALDAAGAPARPAAVSAPAIDDEESVLLDRLRAVMEGDRIYREDGFGLSVLAARLSLPEYRLRRLINQRLGHRNFTSFVNGYRLAETMAALADPSQAEVPILTIALDAGFQSIGPFNRAFKAHTGVTPTAFRRDRRGAAAGLAG